MQSYLHNHNRTKMSVILFLLIYIQTLKKQSLCLDNDGTHSINETSDSFSFNVAKCNLGKVKVYMTDFFLFA